MEVIQTFWLDGILTPRMIKGVIRLIPKEGELFFLWNWRPITLMNVLYKIINKILAKSLKLYLGFLVDEEQTGFITGRRIQDNILAFGVGRDFVKAKRLHALFVMWDFLKAYDRTTHFFVGDT